MREIIYKNGEIVINEKVVEKLYVTEGGCTISVSCESKFQGTPEELAIFTCDRLSKKTGLEIQYNNTILVASTELDNLTYTLEATFGASISH